MNFDDKLTTMWSLQYIKVGLELMWCSYITSCHDQKCHTNKWLNIRIEILFLHSDVSLHFWSQHDMTVLCQFYSLDLLES